MTRLTHWDPPASKPNGEAEAVNAIRIWRDGHLLVAPRDAVLPDRCVKCNQPADGYQLRKTYYWHSPMLYLLAMSPTIILYAIITLFVRKKCTLAIGLCPAHRRRRFRAAILSGSMLVVGIALIAGGFWQAIDSVDNASTILISIGLLALIIGAVLRMFSARVLVAKKADDLHAWYAGAAPEFLRDLPRFP